MGDRSRLADLAIKVSHAEQKKLAIEARRGDRRAADRLVRATIAYVVTRAHLFADRAPMLQLDDLVAEGVTGVLRAAQDYDPGRRTNFLTHARWWIDARIRSAVAAMGSQLSGTTAKVARKVFDGTLMRDEHDLEGIGVSRSEIDRRLAKKYGARTETVISARRLLRRSQVSFDGRPDAEAQAMRLPRPPSAWLSIDGPGVDELADRRRQLGRIGRAIGTYLETATPRQRVIVEQRLLGVRSMREVADQLGISHQRISQIEAEMLGRIRELARAA